MRITISKSRNGNGYYTALKNNYKGVESKMYMPVQLPREMELEFGTYDFICFLSCYTGNDGIVRPKIVLTSLKEKNIYTTGQQNSGQVSTQVTEQVNNDPYAEFGKEINLDDNWLD